MIDNYHVVALATKALDEVRREHWNELRHAGESDAAKKFKDERWALLKNPEDLSDHQAATLAAIHAAGGKVPRAWAMKEMSARSSPTALVEAVEKLIDRLLARLSRSRLEPFVRLGRTIRKHREGILAARRLNLSNARAEALNNKAKLIVRRAYGFHSARAALALILLTCGPVTLTLPHDRFARVTSPTIIHGEPLFFGRAGLLVGVALARWLEGVVAVRSGWSWSCERVDAGELGGDAPEPRSLLGVDRVGVDAFLFALIGVRVGDLGDVAPFDVDGPDAVELR